MKKGVIVACLSLLFVVLGSSLLAGQVRGTRSNRQVQPPATSQAGGLPALARRVQNLEAQVADLTAKVAAQQIEITALKSDVATLKTDVKSLQDSVATIEDAVTDLQGQNNWAVIDSSGTVVRHSGDSGVTAAKGATGTYVVTFAEKDVSGCAYVVAVGDVGKASATPGFVTVASGANTTDVQVQTFDKAGVAADAPFHLYVSCK